MKPNTLPKLPIDAYKEAIQEAVDKNDVVIIQAETGAGKSTQVPQYLMESGKKVVVTQPRRLAARSVAQRVAEEVHQRNRQAQVASTRNQLGETVGFRTAFEKNDGPNTKILFCTDGLQMVRELIGKEKTDVLVIDEVHEWNINIETLVAWTRQQISEGRKMKLVLMSATMEADKLAKFYGEDTPVISVPGRLHPVSENAVAPRQMIESIQELVEKGRNVLVFQPGKKDIADTITALQASGINAEILPLHGELEPKDQQKCFQSYGRPKVIVSTNVAQTSITIPDIDAVVDSGMERRVELSDGIEGLYLKPTSQADCKQRKGRAGRTKAGEYILAADHNMEQRPEFPKSEIERRRLDQLVLRLATVGLDATQLDFFHQPDKATLEEGKRALRAIGAMNEDGKVTEIGRKISKLPLSVQYGRMLVEAEKHGVVDDVLTLVSILETGGIRDKSTEWKKHTQETESDLLAELDLWERAQGKRNGELREMGIHSKSYWRAKELRKKLDGELRRSKVRRGSTGNKKNILRACVAGMVDHLYQSEGYDSYKNGDGQYRQLARESVVQNRPQWIVGLPKDIQFKGRRGLQTLNLVSMASKVDPKWLAEVAPQLVQTQRKNTRWSSEKQAIIEDEITIFNGNEIESKSTEVEESDQAPRIIGGALASGEFKLPCHEHNQAILDELEKLFHRSAGRVARLDIRKYYQEKLKGASSVAEARLMDYEMRLSIDDYCSDELRASIDRDFPETVTISGQEYSLEYEYYGSYSTKSFTARARIDTKTIMTLKPEDIPVLGNEDEQLAITISTTDGRFRCRDISDLQERIEIDHQRTAWNRWQKKPEAELLTIEALEPLPTHQELEAQPIEYGKTVKGEPLLAYPGIKHGNEYCYETGKYIEGYRLVYHEDKETAERVHNKAEAERNKAIEQIQREKDIEELMESAQAAYTEFSERAYEVIDAEGGCQETYDARIELRNALGEIKRLLSDNYWEKPDPRKALEQIQECETQLTQIKYQTAAWQAHVDSIYQLRDSLRPRVEAILNHENRRTSAISNYEAEELENLWRRISDSLNWGGARVSRAAEQLEEVQNILEQKSNASATSTPTFSSSLGDLLQANGKKEVKTAKQKPTAKKAKEKVQEEIILLNNEEKQELATAMQFSQFVAEEILGRYPEPTQIKSKQDNKKAKLIRKLKVHLESIKYHLEQIAEPTADSKMATSIQTQINEIEKLTSDIETRHDGNPDWPDNYQRIINEDIPAIETDWEGKLPEAKWAELRTELIQIARSKTEEIRSTVEELIAEHLE
jgi:HrpA-like RNA helicase